MIAIRKTLTVLFLVILSLLPTVPMALAQSFDHANCQARGDLNADNVVDVDDTFLIARYILGITSFDNACEAAADVNRDTHVSFADLVDTSLYGPVHISNKYVCSTIRGDIDGDCVVDYLDSLAYARVDAQLATVNGNIALCDVHPLVGGDGVINILDSLAVARISQGLVKEFPRTCTAVTQCSDHLDNDHDGLVDLQDPDCKNAQDKTESGSHGLPQCSDGVDNDHDGLVDLADSDCGGPNDPTEGGNPNPTQCSDLIDNDSDGLIDLQDPGCSDANDNNEQNSAPQCNDGVDNDHDGLVDLQDPDCGNAQDPTEGGNPPAPECSDGVDNDHDGNVDMQDIDCANPQDPSEESNVPYVTPMDADAENEKAKIFVSNIRFDPDSLMAGNQLRVLLTFENKGRVDLHHVRVSLTIPELATKSSVGLFDLDKNDGLTKSIVLPLERDVIPGVYDVRIVLSSDEEGAKRVIHRPLTITALPLPPQKVVYRVLTVYCPEGYNNCQIAQA
ncbi:hypothetical protein J4457_01230 [Candidatus Woesearchaeota archaeon]|nr:hypothetical protein [Candidatus Woesearchaeota archaeon]